MRNGDVIPLRSKSNPGLRRIAFDLSTKLNRNLSRTAGIDAAPHIRRVTQFALTIEGNSFDVTCNVVLLGAAWNGEKTSRRRGTRRKSEKGKSEAKNV